LSKVQVDTIDTRSGTSTMQIGSTNTSTINIGVSGDTVNIPSGVTIANAGTATGFAENNKPRFYAYRNGTQSIANNSYTVVQYNAKSSSDGSAQGFDSDNKFDTSTYRFTPTVSGFYYLAAQGVTDSESSHNFHIVLRKNGSGILRSKTQNVNRNTVSFSMVIEADSNDYFDIELMQDSGGGRNILSGYEYNYFTGFKLT